jgi:hypothetical protein
MTLAVMAAITTVCAARIVTNFGVTTTATQRGPEIIEVRTAPVTPAITMVLVMYESPHISFLLFS